jgi:glycosyltransferase involved in cell wall biosynthesis
MAPMGRVHLHDAVRHEEFGGALAAMDLLVVPSRTTPRWKEQFGRVITEAMACEVAVVGSDSGEIPHLIRRSGGGLVFREGDADDLYEQVRSFVVDPGRAREFGRTGARHVAANYTNDVVARRLVADLRSHGLC